MNSREIKIRSFVYDEEFLDSHDVARVRNRIAKRGDVVELSDYWATYGDNIGAFVTEADRKAAEEVGEDVLATAESVEEMGDDELTNWVNDSTIPQVLGVANADPTLCSRILAAENTATGNDPRSGLVKALARIAGSGDTPPETETEESVEDLAKRLGVDLDSVEGSGDDDAVTAEDVKEYYDEEIADATDGAVELAEDNDVFLADIPVEGRITKDDVQKFLDDREAASE